MNSIFFSILTVAASLGIFFGLVRGWDFTLHIPFSYEGDVVFTLMAIKALAVGDWWPMGSVQFQSAGAPFGLHMGDYPNSDGLSFILLKFFSFFTKDPYILFNLLYLIAFPLTALSFLTLARSLRISYPVGTVLGLLFAFLPFHLKRYPHIFLSQYYMLPLMLMVILWLWSKKPLFSSQRRAWIAAAIAVSTAASGLYWSAFSMFFVALAGVSSAIYRKSWRHLRSGIFVGILLLVSTGACTFSSFIYMHEHGHNTEVARRYSVESELYSLKLIQILVPQGNHRIEKFRKLREHYHSITPAVEGFDEAIGIFSILGFFLVSTRFLFLGNVRNKVLDKLLLLLGGGFFLATFGGLGRIIASVLSPEIRCYNRMSVYLALISLTGLAIGIQQLLRRKPFSSHRWMEGILLTLILTIGIYDQVTPDFANATATFQKEIDSDTAFFKRVEDTMKPGISILQLPYMPFPESGPIGAMFSYSHFRAPILSKNLKWSYGAVKGRPGAEEIQVVSQTPLDLEKIRKMGYSGVYIERAGYADSGAKIEKQLEETLRQQPIVSENKRLSFFKI